MLKIILSLSLFLITPFLLAGEPDKVFHQKCLYPVVIVHTTESGTFGSGVIVKSQKVDNHYQNVVLTCSHITNKSKNWLIGVANYENWSDFKNYTNYQSTVYTCNPNEDLAVLLFISDKEMPTAEIGLEEKLFIGNDVSGIGWGLGDIPRPEFGKVSSPNVSLNEEIKNVIRASLHSLPGDSGSPLYHNNKVVGIRQGIRTYRGFPIVNMSYVIPISRLETLNCQCSKSLEFVYKDKPMPVLPFLKLKYSAIDVPTAKSMFKKTNFRQMR